MCKTEAAPEKWSQRPLLWTYCGSTLLGGEAGVEECKRLQAGDVWHSVVRDHVWLLHLGRLTKGGAIALEPKRGKQAKIALFCWGRHRVTRKSRRALG